MGALSHQVNQPRLMERPSVPPPPPGSMFQVSGLILKRLISDKCSPASCLSLGVNLAAPRRLTFATSGAEAELMAKVVLSLWDCPFEF